jgi:hypothetical protein
MKSHWQCDLTDGVTMSIIKLPLSSVVVGKTADGLLFNA